MVIFHSKLLVYQRVQYYLYLYINGDDWGMVGWFMVVLPTSLLEQASSIAYPSRCDRRKIIPFSEYHMNRRVKLLGHILRSNGNDPMRQISFLPDSAHRAEYGTKRVGKPRQNLAASYQKVCLWKHIRALWLWWDSHERSKGVWSSRKQTVLAFSLLLRQRLAAQSRYRWCLLPHDVGWLRRIFIQWQYGICHGEICIYIYGKPQIQH